MQTRLLELLAAYLGGAADLYDIPAIADAIRTEMGGELTDLGQADPGALSDIIGRHELGSPWSAPPVV